MLNKKRFFLFILIVSILFLSGCQNREPEQPLSSFAQIQKDYDAKKIDYDTSTLYKTYSLFNHADLPKKYRSSQKTRMGTTHFKEIRRNWNKLSKETQEKLEPFLMDPLKKGSYYWQKSLAKTYSLIPSAYADDTPALPDFNQLFHHDAANGKIKIWWREGESQQALWLIEAFDEHNIYQRETNLMVRHPKSDLGTVGPDGRLDIILESIQDMGLCVPGDVINHKTSSHIFISKTMSKEEIQNSVAHELFHSIQYNIDIDEADWWQEQTATWIEDYIYKDYDIEHKYLPAYFKNFQMRHSLTFENEKFEYGLYVWPLYLSQKHGASIIKKIWDACESSAALNAFVSTIPGGVDKAFKEFARWVYNTEPERKFRDNGGGFLPITPAIAEHHISIDGVIIPLVDLPILSLTMEKLYLTLQDKQQIRSIDFSLTDFHTEKPKMAVWAIIKIANEDEVVEDWSRVNVRNFCFDLPEEDLEHIVFVFANASLAAPVDDGNLIDYTAKEHGCEAKLSLNWVSQSGGKGNYEYLYKNSGGLKASMGGEIRLTESGELSASFLEYIVDPTDPTDLKSGAKLVPFGEFSARTNELSRGHWAPTQLSKLSGSSVLTGNGSDTWKGKSRSEKEYALLRLNIEMPEPAVSNQIRPEDLALIPPGMQQQLARMQALTASMQNQFNALPGVPRPLAPNERRYKIFVSFQNLPATFSMSMGGSNETEQTTFSPETIDIQGIFNVNQTLIPINHVINNEAGSRKITGTLRIKKQ